MSMKKQNLVFRELNKRKTELVASTDGKVGERKECSEMAGEETLVTRRDRRDSIFSMISHLEHQDNWPERRLRAGGRRAAMGGLSCGAIGDESLSVRTVREANANS